MDRVRHVAHSIMPLARSSTVLERATGLPSPGPAKNPPRASALQRPRLAAYPGTMRTPVGVQHEASQDRVPARGHLDRSPAADHPGHPPPWSLRIIQPALARRAAVQQTSTFHPIASADKFWKLRLSEAIRALN